MNREYLIQLTQNLYKLTLLFPKKEPLRYKMREVADEILASCLKQNPGQNPVRDDLEMLDGFFEVAKAQSWVASAELLQVQEEYNKIKAEFKALTTFKEKNSNQIKKTENGGGRRQERILDSNPLATRQGKILDFLRENGRAQVWQVKQVFPEITKRTLRRDFESLFKKGIIERVGERNNTSYQIKKVGQA